MTNVKHSMQSDQEKQKVDGWLPRAEETRRLNGEQEARGTALISEMIRHTLTRAAQSTSILQTTELNSFNGFFVWYENYYLTKALLIRGQQPGTQAAAINCFCCI